MKTGASHLWTKADPNIRDQYRQRLRWAFGDKKKQRSRSSCLRYFYNRSVEASYRFGTAIAKSHRPNSANNDVMDGLVRSAFQFTQQFEKHRMPKRLLHSGVSAGAATNDRSTLLHYTVYRTCIKNAHILIARQFIRGKRPRAHIITYEEGFTSDQTLVRQRCSRQCPRRLWLNTSASTCFFGLIKKIDAIDHFVLLEQRLLYIKCRAGEGCHVVSIRSEGTAVASMPRV